MESTDVEPSLWVRRRDVLAMSACCAVLTPASGALAQPAAPAAAAALAPVRLPLSLEVNGVAYAVQVDTRATLLDLLRETLELTGTKKGCDHGQCGACTVVADGRRINACLSLALMHEGGRVTTIEGFGSPDHLHPMQAAFVKHDGYQCGYCTPGQICSAIGTLAEIKAGVPSHVTADLVAPVAITDAELRERMSGNICRCGAYSNIVDAMNDAKGQMA